MCPIFVEVLHTLERMNEQREQFGGWSVVWALNYRYWLWRLIFVIPKSELV